MLQRQSITNILKVFESLSFFLLMLSSFRSFVFSFSVSLVISDAVITNKHCFLLFVFIPGLPEISPERNPKVDLSFFIV